MQSKRVWPSSLGLLQFVNQAQDSGGEVGLRLRGITQNVKILRKGACRMWEEAVHLALNFVPQLLGHVARSADGERIDAVRNADVEFFAHAVRWDDAAVCVALVAEEKHGNAGMLDHRLSVIRPLRGKSRRAGRDL